MNIAISNLSWDSEDDDKVFEYLNSVNINKIEGVLTKIKPWNLLTKEDVIDYKKKLDKNNIQVYSLQSLFYGSDITNLIDENKTIQHLEKLIEYAKILNVKVLVLGSPTLRKFENFVFLDLIFKKIDELLDGTDITLVIEPNSKSYGAEYFNVIQHVSIFIHKNGLNNVKTMIDTHNCLLEKRNPIDEFINNFEDIHHIHISEIELSPIHSEYHSELAKQIRLKNYDGVITYELKKCDNLFETIDYFLTMYK